MKRILAIAAVLLASTAAHAGEAYTFDIGGRIVHIDAPSNCRSASCVSISVPGIYESKRKRSRSEEDAAKSDTAAKSAVPQAASVIPAPAAAPAPVAAAPSVVASAPIEQPSTNPPATYAAPAPVVAPPASVVTQSAPAPVVAPGTVVASAPVSAPVQTQQTAPAAAHPVNSPLGVWLTEEKEGKVRIEQCGVNLCGYSVNAKTDANGDKVLINMKAVNDMKWSGRIFDPNSGSTYDSTIALKNPNSLRVQGCAFGGMFCGGQTWSRVN